MFFLNVHLLTPGSSFWQTSIFSLMLAAIFVLLVVVFGLVLFMYNRMGRDFLKVKGQLEALRSKSSRHKTFSSKQGSPSKGVDSSAESLARENRDSLKSLEQKTDELTRLLRQIDEKVHTLEGSETASPGKSDSGSHDPSHNESPAGNPDKSSTGSKSEPEAEEDQQQPQQSETAAWKVKYFGMADAGKNSFVQEESLPERINYRLQVDEITGRGEFEIYFGEEANERIMINQPDLFIKPACSIRNSQISNPSGLKMSDKGKVKRTSEGWYITQKAVVEWI